MKKILLTLLTLFYISTAFSQFWFRSPDKQEVDESNFHSKQKAFYEFIADKDINEIKGVKQFKRVEYFFERRVDKYGKLPAHNYWQVYEKNKTLQKNKSISANWEQVGSSNIPRHITNKK